MTAAATGGRLTNPRPTPNLCRGRSMRGGAGYCLMRQPHSEEVANLIVEHYSGGFDEFVTFSAAIPTWEECAH